MNQTINDGYTLCQGDKMIRILLSMYSCLLFCLVPRVYSISWTHRHPECLHVIHYVAVWTVSAFPCFWAEA